MYNAFAVSLLLLAPGAVLAGVSGTQFLLSGTSLNLDRGTKGSPGADIIWNGGAIVPQGAAKLYNIGVLGSGALSTFNRDVLAAYGPLYLAESIPFASLVEGDLFAVTTNGGNFTIVLVTANSAGAITIQFRTFSSADPAQPAISALMNGFSYIPAGFPNSGIAPGALFLVFGTGLADADAQLSLQSSMAGGLPLSLNGTAVKIDSGGVITTPAIYYATANQLALVLPSNTPVGPARITVSHSGVESAAYNFQVSSAAMGFDTYYGIGSGLAVVTNPETGELYNYSHAIPPGSTVTLWGSGLGADAVRDTTYVPGARPIRGLEHVYVGGVEAAILYQGASGFPGVNQVNITIPASAPAGCTVALAGVTANGILSNTTTLPIGRGPCSDPATGNTGDALDALGSKSAVRYGVLVASHSSTVSAGGAPDIADNASALFQSAAGLSFVAASGASPSAGCVVTQSLKTVNGSGYPSGLDAGEIKLGAPTGVTATLLPPSGSGFYYARIPPAFAPATGGVFSFSSAGGKDVGKFTSRAILPREFRWTNVATTLDVVRSSGLRVSWTGTGPATLVTVTGTSSSPIADTVGSFFCTAPAEAGEYTVPSWILSAVPEGIATVSVTAVDSELFSAPGIDVGISTGQVVSTAPARFR